jgi:hypothetical protein
LSAFRSTEVVGFEGRIDGGMRRGGDTGAEEEQREQHGAYGSSRGGGRHSVAGLRRGVVTERSLDANLKAVIESFLERGGKRKTYFYNVNVSNVGRVACLKECVRLRKIVIARKDQL